MFGGRRCGRPADPTTRVAATILCDGAAEHVTVVVLGGVHVFRFSRVGELLARASDLDQLAGRPGEVAAHFAGGDGGRERALAKVAPRVGISRASPGLNEHELAQVEGDGLERQSVLCVRVGSFVA
jgi:hypothetical protein